MEVADNRGSMVLIRKHYGKGTIGELHMPSGKVFYTLELPLKLNRKGQTTKRVSRIAEGSYRIIRRTFGGYFQRYNKKFGHEFVVEIAGVDNRSDILIHIGNFLKNTLGCVLIGKTFNANAFTIGRSTEAYKEFYEEIADSQFNCYINRLVVIDTQWLDEYQKRAA